jgi:hypothetical protein
VLKNEIAVSIFLSTSAKRQKKQATGDENTHDKEFSKNHGIFSKTIPQKEMRLRAERG